MVNTCLVIYCKTGYKKRENKEDKIPKKHPVFGFPDNKSDLKAKRVKFVSRMSWLPTKNSGICARHFEESFLKVQSCKLDNNKYMIASPQITNIDIFPFIAALVFKLLSRKVLFINRKDNRNY